MLAGLSRRLHGLIADVESYSLQSGTQRVIGYLLRQDEEQASAAAPYSVTLPTSKAIVASRLNLTPEHFSRILHDLTEAGLIAVEGREVLIKDVAEIAQRSLAELSRYRPLPASLVDLSPRKRHRHLANGLNACAGGTRLRPQPLMSVNQGSRAPGRLPA